MSPITFQEAFDATNPADSEDKRNASASAIMAGTAANDAYWDSRSELEALKARAEGHGVVTRAEDPPQDVTAASEAPAVDSTATEEPAAAIEPPSADPAGTQPAPTPTNAVEAVAKLRAQLSNAGMTPDA